MGRESRQREARTRAVHFYTCEVCGREFPSLTAPDPVVQHLDVCQRCAVNDIARLMRLCPETVRFLPTVRTLRGEAQVVEVFRELL